jgi:hypothetical protein
VGEQKSVERQYRIEGSYAVVPPTARPSGG